MSQVQKQAEQPTSNQQEKTKAKSEQQKKRSQSSFSSQYSTNQPKLSLRAKHLPIQAKHQPVKSKHQSIKSKHLPIQAKQSPMEKFTGIHKNNMPQSLPASLQTTSEKKIPEPLKSNMEKLGGVDLSDVKVHRNSDKPGQVDALAYAQGSNIFLAPGQEKHLGHEAWHTVQQKQGRVKPNKMFKRNTSINDDPKLEREADEMASRAMQFKCATCAHQDKKNYTRQQEKTAGTIQRKTPPTKKPSMSLPRSLDQLGLSVDQITNKVMSKLEAGSKVLLDQVMPVGQGITFQMDGGVTWGIPMYTGATITIDVKRTSQDKVNLLVHKRGTVAYDAGFGASFFLGRPSKKGNGGGLGIGGEMGAHFQAGMQGTFIEEYDIPVTKFLQFVSSSILNSYSILGVANSFKNPINHLLIKHAHKYKTRIRAELGVFAKLSAEKGVGIRRSTTDGFQNNKHLLGFRSGDRSWDRTGKRDFQSDPKGVLNALGRFASTQARGQIAVGMEQKRQGKKTITSAYFEGEIGVMLGLPIKIPLIHRILSLLPSGVGAGLELIFIQQPDKEPQTHLKIYQKQGEDQIYAGQANQQEFKFDLTKMISFKKLVEGLKNGKIEPTIKNLSATANNLSKVFKEVTFFNRILLTGNKFGTLKAFLRKQQGTRSLLSDQTRKSSQDVGFGYAVYLDFGSQMKGPDFTRIVKKLTNTSQKAYKATKNSKGISQTYQALRDFLTGYAKSPELTSLIDDVLDSLVINKASLRIQGTAGFGFSGALAAGAKVRGDLSIQGGKFCEADYIKIAGKGGRMNLRHMINTFPSVMNDPVRYIPNCPLLRDIYRAFTEDKQRHSKKPDQHHSKKTIPSKGRVRNNPQDRHRLHPGDIKIADRIPKYTKSIDLSMRLLSKLPNTGQQKTIKVELIHPAKLKIPLRIQVLENNAKYVRFRLMKTWWIAKHKVGQKAGTILTLRK